MFELKNLDRNFIKRIQMEKIKNVVTNIEQLKYLWK